MAATTRGGCPPGPCHPGPLGDRHRREGGWAPHPGHPNPLCDHHPRERRVPAPSRSPGPARRPRPQGQVPTPGGSLRPAPARVRAAMAAATRGGCPPQPGHPGPLGDHHPRERRVLAPPPITPTRATTTTPERNRRQGRMPTASRSPSRPSRGHPVTRPRGHPVTRSRGHAVTRSRGDSVTQSPSHAVAPERPRLLGRPGPRRCSAEWAARSAGRSLRRLMPSLRKTRVRCCSTVLGVTYSRSAISRLV